MSGSKGGRAADDHHRTNISIFHHSVAVILHLANPNMFWINSFHCTTGGDMVGVPSGTLCTYSADLTKGHGEYY